MPRGECTCERVGNCIMWLFTRIRELLPQCKLGAAFLCGIAFCHTPECRLEGRVWCALQSVQCSAASVRAFSK